MKKILVEFTAAVAVMSLLLLPACASRNEAPDPVRVQEEIAEHRVQEVDLVRATVMDQKRADRIIDLLADRDRMISVHTNEIIEYREKMAALNADYNAQRESFDVLMTSYNNQRETAQKEFVALLELLKKETTAEEWKKISKYQLKRLSPRKLTYGQASGGV